MQTTQECVFLHVVDNGVGIPAELQARIFDLFTQAERNPDRTQGGLGIGLALVKSLVELHAGSVSCQSEGPGMGSSFVVTLPKLHRSQGAHLQQDLAHPAAPLARQRILVVDDNVDAAQVLAMYLEVAGHDILVEHSAMRALETARTNRPDVCILDIGLPETDGYQLARMLRSDAATAHGLLIALTGYGQEQDRAQAMAAGFDHHLVKPVDSAALLRLIASRHTRATP